MSFCCRSSFASAQLAGSPFVHTIHRIDTVAACLDMEPVRFGRKDAGRKSTFAEDRAAVLAFVQSFEPFDWTANLDGWQPSAAETPAAGRPER